MGNRSVKTQTQATQLSLIFGFRHRDRSNRGELLFSEFGNIKGKLVSIGSDALLPDQIYSFYRFPTKIELSSQQYMPCGYEDCFLFVPLSMLPCIVAKSDNFAVI